MKRIGFMLVAAMIATSSFAQSAKSVLDKAAATVTAASGVKANFRMSTTTGNTSGTIAIKGKKFFATTPQAKVWFDGKTQWTYLKNNDEVNISNPTEAQLQAINPYNFINLYKHGYTYTMNTAGTNYVTNKRSNKTIPGSLIAQGLSGLNDAKIRNFFKPARFFLIFSTP